MQELKCLYFTNFLIDSCCRSLAQLNYNALISVKCPAREARMVTPNCARSSRQPTQTKGQGFLQVQKLYRTSIVLIKIALKNKSQFFSDIFDIFEYCYNYFQQLFADLPLPQETNNLQTLCSHGCFKINIVAIQLINAVSQISLKRKEDKALTEYFLPIYI